MHAAVSEDGRRAGAVLDRHQAGGRRQPHDGEDTPEAVEDLWRAVRVVVVANIVMSLDNVIAVAAAAEGQLCCCSASGLAVSIPVVDRGQRACSCRHASSASRS